MLDEKIDCLKCKKYTWWDYISSISEYFWVQTYHRYFCTQKYKDWALAMHFVEEWNKKNEQKLVEHLKK